MPKVRTVGIRDHWKSIKGKKRSEFNKEWDKTRSEVLDSKGKIKKGVMIEFNPDGRYDHPKEVPLDQAVAFMEKGYGSDIRVVFRDDVSEEEINVIMSLIESDINANK